MTAPHVSELIFQVREEPEGGYSAVCTTESIVTQGDTWDELRAMVKDAVEGYYFDDPKPRTIRLQLILDEVLIMQ
jgi:predicted RNase H-like HicB family nuclease